MEMRCCIGVFSEIVPYNKTGQIDILHKSIWSYGVGTHAGFSFRTDPRHACTLYIYTYGRAKLFIYFMNVHGGYYDGKLNMMDVAAEQ